MSKELTTIAGIDLGTTYSCVACVDEHGKPVVLTNFEGDRTTPSVVYYESTNNIIVGSEAKNNLKISPEHSVELVKRSLADPNFLFNHEGIDYRAEEISSFIIKKVVNDASQKLDSEITDVVITCPAYFGINEREATKKAGEIAGLNVRDIINEPTAAAISYGVEQSEDKVILVYDLGGGTFDITMISVTEKEIKVIVTGGDHNLGGRNWDDKVVQYLAEKFAEENDSENTLLDDPETLNALYLEAERAKKTLSQREKTTIVVQHDGDKARIELTRETFESLTKDLLERTILLTNDMLKEAEEKGVPSFDELILVGGSSKMPMVENRLQSEYKKTPKLHDPDEAVAKGAALYAHKLSINDELVRRIARTLDTTEEEVNLEEVDKDQKKEAIEELALVIGGKSSDIEKTINQRIINVTSKSFGVVAIESTTNEEKLFNLILKNEAVPITFTQEFGTSEDNQENVLLRIMSNEVKDQVLDPMNGVEIGEATLSLPAGLPANSPLDITYRINEDGTLFVEAIERSEGRKVETSIETNSVISEEEEVAAKERSQAMTIS